MEKESKEKKIVVGFWMRMVSDILDALFLGLLGFLLSIPFKDLFYSIGENGLWIGLCVTFFYTGILQSKIGQGQTLAKKVLKIQVLQLDGTYLSLAKSFVRYIIIALIFYNQWIGMGLVATVPALNNEMFMTFYGYAVFVLIIGFVTLVAFHPLKRGLHDLLVGSIVVRKGAFSKEKIEQLNDSPKAKRAYVIWVLCSVLVIWGLNKMVNNQNMLSPLMIKEMTSITEEIGKTTALKSISMNHNWFHGTNGKKSNGVNVLAFLDKKTFDQEDLRNTEVEKAVSLVISSYSRVNECDYVNVQVRTGYNIGIWSWYYRLNNSFSKDGVPLK